MIPYFILITPLYVTWSADGNEWVRKGSFYVNVHWMVQITLHKSGDRAVIVMHDGTSYTVPSAQVETILAVES
jgi:hypothetical protein